MFSNVHDRVVTSVLMRLTTFDVEQGGPAGKKGEKCDRLVCIDTPVMIFYIKN